MRTIEIDFDVYKALTLKRETEDVSYNDVLRAMLELGPAPKLKKSTAEDEKTGLPWVAKSVSFPHGTEFRSFYKGQEFRGQIDNGALVVKGKKFNSPSAAAVSITGNPVNGWVFWECRMPGQSSWTKISSLRNP